MSAQPTEHIEHANPDDVSPDIYLKSIDTDHLENIEENREAIHFRVRLSAKPTAFWQTEFTQAYEQTPYTLKPPVRLEDDLLHITYLPRYTDELPAFFKFLALITRRSNEETHRTEELHTSNAQERSKAAFRDALKRIELPQGAGRRTT